MDVALPDVGALKLLRSRAKTAPEGVASSKPLARGPLGPGQLGPGSLALGSLGTKLPALVGLACARIDELRAVFARARTPDESALARSEPGKGGPGKGDADVTKRMVLRVDRLIRWIDKVRALVPGAEITPDIAARLEVAFAGVIELVCGRIEDLGEALTGRREREDTTDADTSRADARRVGLRRMALDTDRMIRWAARLKKLVARAKPGGPELPPELVARLDGALATVVRLVCSAVDALTVAFDEDREPEVIDGVMSQLDRMLRWVERMKKLGEPAKRIAPAASPRIPSPGPGQVRARPPVAKAEASGAASRATKARPAGTPRPRGKVEGKSRSEAPHPAAVAPDLAAEAVTGRPMPAGAGASR